MNTFSFRPSARLQRYLGRELIADPNLAIIEFVKNAYDAGATNVWIEFKYPDDNAPYLVISDDGSGMTEKQFEQNWMHPGYSEKSPDARTNRSTKKSDRVPAGEKGLGRLAAGRLGESLEVFTRPRAKDPWLHINFVWSAFDDMTKMIDEVEIPFDHAAPAEDSQVRSGTILIIHDLSLAWDGRIRGRPVPGRSRTRLGRLKQDLRLLVRPLQATDTSFTIHLDSESVAEVDDIGTISPEAAVSEADYVYDFIFTTANDGSPVVERELHRSPKLIDEFGGQDHRVFPPIHVASANDDDTPSLECGPFTGRFYYTPPPAAQRAKEIQAVGSGVLLYRDGVLVEPYGMDGDDWVGVSARKAQRQGYALVQPSTFSGYVLISRDENPDLRDMSNRLGLLDSEVSEQFVQLVREEFAFFESEVFEELRKRWESKEEKAAKQSEESIDLAAVRLRAIAHSLGQPLLGLDADISSLRLLAERDEVPEFVRTHMLRLADSAQKHLRQAQEAMSKFRTVAPSERTQVTVGALVKAAYSEEAALAESLGVALDVGPMPRQKVLVHEELIVEAIKELIRNGIEAPRSAGGGSVTVGHHEHEGDFVLDIVDDGLGIPGLVDGDLSDVASTKGRPGVGLSTVIELVSASRGRVRVAYSGSSGTHIELHLPERVKGLRD